MQQKQHQQPSQENLSQPDSLILVALLDGGMVLLCIACAVWLVTMWKLFPQIDLFYPGMQTKLLLGFVLMVLATLIALFALVRGSRALRAVHAAPHK